MKNDNRIPIILMVIAIVLLIAAIVITWNTETFHFSTSNKELENQNTEETTENNPQNGEEEKPEDSTEQENQVPQPEPSVTPEIPSIEPTPTNPPSIETPSSTFQSESDLISYFQQELYTVSSNPNQEDMTLREKIKNTFITIIDFIFYDKEIKGYTFSELTTSAKLKVIEIALKIDSKIDEYFPNYKEVIKDKYANIKGKLGVKYLEFTSYLCETVGGDTCMQAKEDFRTMKDSFATTWEFLKELASSGSSKLKEFYENWRDSE